MDSDSADSSSQPQTEASDVETSAEVDTDVKSPASTNDMKSHSMANIVEPPFKAYDNEPPKAGDNASTVTVKTINSPEPQPSDLPSTGISSWTRILNLPQPTAPPQESQAGNAGSSAFARLTSGLGLQSMTLPPDNHAEHTSAATQTVLESFKKGIDDSSLTAVKAVQVKARHIVSQNKRRYQEGEFDLDLTYFTENIISMGFPAGDLSSGLLGFFEGFYWNKMEEVIKFFETHHKGRYKVYNICSDRLYDASLFQGKVASFPFDDHNCPPLHLIKSFCQSAYSWLKEDIENLVVVRCKAGMGRTGASLGASGFTSVLIGLGPPLPSLITVELSSPLASSKHLKTKNLMPEDFWIKAPTKGIVSFALPREPGLTEKLRKMKSWLNSTMIENRTMLNASDLDGFDKGNVPYHGFNIELVNVDYDGTLKTNPKPDSANQGTEGNSSYVKDEVVEANSKQSKASRIEDSNDIFSDSDGEESGASISKPTQPAAAFGPVTSSNPSKPAAEQIGTSMVAIKNQELLSNNSSKDIATNGGPSSGLELPSVELMGASDIKAMAAEASVFSLDDEEVYKSE
ncbi:Exonuclease, putative isoform 1 [Hibiscus syriacus]|uniref:Exonuclease, putative isoform 1 n=1 Tax=Hibiscus syriacus TaxID=106335 RepID=A0A6A2ZT52_HIBSY|nr:Exonuclease, putative isoform 1 [Hibiscus syriacus]